ncbi:MAG: hypothetical protein M0D55_01825 [Elusimicrobiota bacterium]|nr:MAG: hypothetical protein M0D55_01825 [Elusimicrobiota bacterium]
MKPLLALLLLAASARAGVPEPGAPTPAKEPHFYYHSQGTQWWGDVVNRKGITMTSDLGKLDEVCLIPPAADWIRDGASEEIQKKYLHLLHRVAWSINNAKGGANPRNRTIGTCGVNASAMIVGFGDYSNFFVGSFDDSIKKRTGFTSCRATKDFVEGSPKYASTEKKLGAPGVAVSETLNILLKSKHPETVLGALSALREITSFEPFRESVEALVRDKSLTATVTIEPPDEGRQTIPLRVYAMRTLATMERTERTAKIMALIWHDEKETAEIREGAIRSFAFVAQWPGTAIDTMTSAEKRAAMHKALFQFIVPIMNLGGVEADKKEEAGAKAQLSPLGQAASCALDMFPKELRAKARRGEKP